MAYNATQGLETPERFDRSNERLTDCPVCGTPIDGFAADARTTVEPCGHSAAQLTTATMTRDTTSDAHRVMTDGGDPPAETHVDEDRGLWIPPEFRDFEKQIVIRTPRGTIQHFGNQPLDAYYGLVDASSFGASESFRECKNPNLAPSRVSLKPQGEDRVELDVEIHPEVRADGGEDVVYYASGMYDVFHERRDCRYLAVVDTVCELSTDALNGSREPCSACASDETSTLATDGGEDMVLISSKRAHRRRYHRSESCRYVTEADRVRRLPLSLAGTDQPCSFCAADEADTEREVITVCPECNHAGIQPANGGITGPSPDHNYRCKSCSATFDEPDERQRKSADGGRAGLAGKLMQADPEDVSADHVDGGESA